MLLWKQIVQNYLKKLPYFFFLTGGAALYASSLIPISCAVGYFHIIAQYSALAFVFLGVIMLLQAKEKLSVKFLLISSLSFSLAVACRPTALLMSILIPVALWDKRKELMNASKVLAIIVPFAIVGSILAWYNYARFDSIFEFGTSYVIVPTNLVMYSQVGIIGKIHLLIKAFLFHLFNPPVLYFTFPFVSAENSYVPLAATNMFLQVHPIVGIFCFPLMWFLFYVKKVDILRNFIFAGIFISLPCIVTYASVSIIWRYNMDFSWIMAIGALICAFQMQENEVAMRKVVLKAFYSCCGMTILLVFFLTISYRVHGNGNGINILDPKLYHYLARTFGVICNVP